MADATMIPFAAENSGWDAGVGGAIGGFLGSWFGNGWLGNGEFGYGNRGFGFGNAGIVATTDNAVADSVIVDSLSRISDQVSGVNTTLLNSQAQQNSSMCQGFSGLNQSIFEASAGLSRDIGTGFNALANTLVNGNNQINQNMTQGFANAVSAVNANGTAARFDTLTGFNNMQRAIDSCCCNTQNALATGFGNLALENCQNTGRIVGSVQAEGSATRALINQNYINELQTQLCDAKAKIGSLESQQFTSNALAAQSALWDRKLTDAINTIVTEVKSSSTTPTTASTTA